MNSEEIQKIVEQVERARDKKEKPIGTTIAVFAALLAIVTVGSHRQHTKEVFAQAEIVDEWSFYTAKHARAHDYGREAEFAALLSNGKDLANRDYKKSIEEQCGVPPGDCQSPVEDADLEKALSAAAAANGNEGTGQPGKPAAKPVGLKGEQKESERTPDKNKLGAVDLLAQVQKHQKEQVTIEHAANALDAAVVLLEFSIVLCTISLVGASRMFWKSSFLTAALGAMAMLYGGFLLWYPWLSQHF